MKRHQAKNYIIQQLLEHNYNIYIGICSDTIAVERDNYIGTAIILFTTTGSHDRIILDMRSKDNRTTLPYTNLTYIIAFCMANKKIWLIPLDDIADNSTVTMSDNKAHYEIVKQLSIKPIIIPKQEAKVIKNIIKLFTTSEDEQKAAVFNILNIKE